MPTQPRAARSFVALPVLGAKREKHGRLPGSDLARRLPLQCDDVRLQCDDAGFNGAMSACIATMYAYNESMSINKTTMQTAIGSLQVNNVTMEAYNGAMGVNNVAMEAYNAALRAYNAVLQINKNVLTRYITRGYKKWPIFREPNRPFWPWSRK